MSVSFYVVSAICGNFYGESGVNPARVEIGVTITDLADPNQYGGYGLGQWTNNPATGLVRRTNLINWLDNNGYSRDSGEGEMNFLIYENHWVRNYGSINSLTDFLNSDSTDVHELARIWWRNWEGIIPSQQSQRDRINFADNVLPYLIEHYDDASINQWTARNDYLTETEMKNNSVLICRNLTGGIPPVPPTPPPTHRKMPLWMYLRKI